MMIVIYVPLSPFKESLSLSLSLYVRGGLIPGILDSFSHFYEENESILT